MKSNEWLHWSSKVYEIFLMKMLHPGIEKDANILDYICCTVKDQFYIIFSCTYLSPCTTLCKRNNFYKVKPVFMKVTKGVPSSPDGGMIN